MDTDLIDVADESSEAFDLSQSIRPAFYDKNVLAQLRYVLFINVLHC